MRDVAFLFYLAVCSAVVLLYMDKMDSLTCITSLMYSEVSIFTDRVSTRGNAIASFCLSVYLFPL